VDESTAEINEGASGALGGVDGLAAPGGVRESLEREAIGGRRDGIIGCRIVFETDDSSVSAVVRETEMRSVGEICI